MIKKLSYIATFNSTGRTLKNQLTFKPGITVIRGENEAGKSFVLEMIRYALYGSDALRGKRSDYDKLEVTLLIEVKGKNYSIVRKGNKATVNINEAVGTTATNNFIEKLLGFDLTVFDICANAKQGELDALTNDMKPTQRREMVDQVIGLKQFEEVEKECRTEANNYRRLAEALMAQVTELVEPEKPDDYEPSEALRSRVEAETRIQAQRDALVHIERPEAPVLPSAGIECLALHRQYEVDQQVRTQIANRLEKLPEISHNFTKEQLARYRRSIEQRERGPEPEWHPESQLDSWHTDWIKIQTSGEVIECDNCGHIVSGEKPPKEPPLTIQEIGTERQRQRNWVGYSFDPRLLPYPKTSLETIAQYERALESDAERQLLLSQLEDLGPEPESYAKEVAEWDRYSRELVRYEEKLMAYESYLTRKAEVDALPEPEPLLREKLDMAIRYETLLAKHEAAVEAQEKIKEQAEEAKETQEGYKRGSNALKAVRSEIKQYIIPALSKVSSQLLQEMTAGERRRIFITDEFEIFVDKQHVRTLSGSGVSVVNLALRIALGQVLTQSVIPIFLADEIDANMAEKRTKATHESLRRLKSRLTQMIVVTHKNFEGDETLWLKAQ